MHYRPLSKLYYDGAEKYMEAYTQRFHSESTCHLDFLIGDAPAFFLVTTETLSRLTSIYKSDKHLTQLRSRLPGAAIGQFTISSLVDEILLTNSIEGVHSTRREIEDVLDSLRQNDQRKRFQGLVQKYTLLQTSEDIPLKTPEDLRAIYDELVLAEVREEDAGDVPDGRLFRKEITYVTSAAGKVLHAGVYPEEKILSSLEKALAFLNDEDCNLLLRLSVFHYLFGYIHPFYNGNGRTSRFISSYLIAKELDPLVGYRLSYSIKESIHDYYQAFRLCNDRKNKGDLTPFLLVFLEIIDHSMKDLVYALQKRLERWNYYSARCQALLCLDKTDQKTLPLCDLLIQASLFGTKGISSDDLCTQLGISKPTLTSRLKALSPEELVSVVVEGHRKYYRLDLSVLDSLGNSSSPRRSP